MHYFFAGLIMKTYHFNVEYPLKIDEYLFAKS